MELLLKHREKFTYIIFGVLTTAINIISYIFFADFLEISTLSANAMALLLSIIFAFITNKVFVFQSHDFRLITFWKEGLSFFGLRLVSAVLDMGLMFVFVEILLINDLLVKVAVNIIVIILNYIFSKIFIFKKE